MRFVAWDVISKSFWWLFDDKFTLAVAAGGGALGAATYLVAIQFVRAPAPALAEIVGVLPMAIVGFIVGLFVQEAVVVRGLSGFKGDISETLGTTVGKYPVFLATTVAFYVAFAVGLVALVLPGIYLALRLSLAPLVSIAENVGPLDALRRSWNLTRGNALGMLYVYGAVVLTASIAQAVVSMVSGVVGQFLFSGIEMAAAVSWCLVYRALAA